MKIRFLLFIFFINFFLTGQTFSSNAIGMPLNEISEVFRDDYEYILEINEMDNEIYKVLYRNEQIVYECSTIYDTPNRYTEIKKESSKTTVTIYENNLILQERTQVGTEEISLINYFYENHRLMKIEELTNGNVTEKEYFYDDQGRLLLVRKTSPDIDDIEVFYRYKNGSLNQYIQKKTENAHIISFDDGKIVTESYWDAETEFRKISIEEIDGLRYVYESDHRNLLEIERIYDGNKLIEEIFKTSSGELLSIHKYRYNENSQLLQETIETGISLELRDYFYSSDNSLSQVRTKRNGQLSSVKNYLAPDEYFETIYRFGKPFLEVHFIDEQKISEKFLEDTDE